MSAELRAEIEKDLDLGTRPCGFCGGYLEYQGLSFSGDKKKLVIEYQCERCGRYYECYREIDRPGDTDGDSGQYPCEDSDCMDYKAEYEKLREKNKELEHQIEIYIKVLEEQNSMAEEDLKTCVGPDYEAEYHKLKEELKEVKKNNTRHCRTLILIRDLIDLIEG